MEALPGVFQTVKDVFSLVTSAYAEQKDILPRIEEEKLSRRIQQIEEEVKTLKLKQQSGEKGEGASTSILDKNDDSLNDICSRLDALTADSKGVILSKKNEPGRSNKDPSSAGPNYGEIRTISPSMPPSTNVPCWVPPTSNHMTDSRGKIPNLPQPPCMYPAPPLFTSNSHMQGIHPPMGYMVNIPNQQPFSRFGGPTMPLNYNVCNSYVGQVHPIPPPGNYPSWQASNVMAPNFRGPQNMFCQPNSPPAPNNGVNPVNTNDLRSPQVQHKNQNYKPHGNYEEGKEYAGRNKTQQRTNKAESSFNNHKEPSSSRMKSECKIPGPCQNEKEKINAEKNENQQSTSNSEHHFNNNKETSSSCTKSKCWKPGPHRNTKEQFNARRNRNQQNTSNSEHRFNIRKETSSFPTKSKCRIPGPRGNNNAKFNAERNRNRQNTSNSKDNSSNYKETNSFKVQSVSQNCEPYENKKKQGTRDSKESMNNHKNPLDLGNSNSKNEPKLNSNEHFNARNNQAYKKGNTKDEKDDQAHICTDSNVLMKFVGHEIPSILQAFHEGIDLNQRVYCIQMSSDHGEVYTPATLLDIINYKSEHPNAISHFA